MKKVNARRWARREPRGAYTAEEKAGDQQDSKRCQGLATHPNGRTA
jgi:hypothetical protein